MTLTLKDYITLAFSAIALCLSLYNFYRSQRDARAANIRTIEQKRFECLAIAAEAKGSHLRSEAALEAVRFDAQRAGDAEVVRMADTQISSEEKSINDISEIEKEGRIDAVVDGTLEELLAVEKLVGSMKTLKANAAEGELKTSSLIAAARRKLLAASLVAPQSLPPALNT